MSKTQTTIKPKPDVSQALESFIGAENQNQPSAPALSVIKTVSQPASLQAVPMTMLSIRIPASLHQDMRVHSVTVGRNIQDIVTELLKNYLAEQNQQG